MRLFSYVVEHDTGLAPNPENKVCTLVYCKYKRRNGRRRNNIVELAKKGDWIIGTGGADENKSSGNGTIVYIMQVDANLPFSEYEQRFPFRAKPKKPSEHGERALVSRTFLYFGKKAIPITDIPASVRGQLRRWRQLRRVGDKIEKKGPGFRSDFPEPFICQLARWVRAYPRKGKIGEPCAPSCDATPKKTCRCRRQP